MRLTAREDVEAPIAFVFQALADTDHWERAALRRGAEVMRRDALPAPGAGMEWTVGFAWRDRPRRVTLRLSDYVPGQRLGITARGEALAATVGLDLVEMGPRRTRIAMAAEVKPLTLAARLFLQGLRLARRRVETRLARQMAALAADIERRHGRRAPR